MDNLITVIEDMLSTARAFATNGRTDDAIEASDVAMQTLIAFTALIELEREPISSERPLPSCETVSIIR